MAKEEQNSFKSIWEKWCDLKTDSIVPVMTQEQYHEQQMNFVCDALFFICREIERGKHGKD